MIDLDAAIQDALRAHDAPALAGYRALKTKAAVKLAEPGRAQGEPGAQGERKPLSEEEMFALIRREVKERKEANEYLQAGDPEHAVNARIETLLQAHLPTSLSPEAAEALIQKTIAEVKPSGPRDMGRVMAALREGSAAPGGAPPALDMGAASARVKALLAGMS